MVSNIFSKLAAIIMMRMYPHLNNSSRLLVDAEKITKSLSLISAIEFVEKYNKGDYEFSLILLKANRDIKSEIKWLNRINLYLNSMNAHPIYLSDSNEDRFYRLRCNPNSKVSSAPLVSIIMTSYNSGSTIAHAITSILSQTWTNIELLIIDDLSTDNTWEIIKALASKDQRIKPFRNSHNVGTYVSKNIALSHINGEFITCHDSDDWSHPQRIEKQLTQMILDNAKASIILKIRVFETMEITRFKRINDSCIDGITHYSLPSLMFESTFFKQKIGAWDSVRFSADKEVFERTHIALNGNIQKYKIFGQICLEAAQSLTNNSKFGLKHSKRSKSPRKLYRKAYREWHKSLTQDCTYLAFPQKQRKFKAPDIALVSNNDINKLLS